MGLWMGRRLWRRPHSSPSIQVAFLYLEALVVMAGSAWLEICYLVHVATGGLCSYADIRLARGVAQYPD